MEPIRILIADDDAGMRTVMRKLVERAEGYALAGEASDGEELLALYDSERPDVVLMDVEMPKIDGVECAKIIQDRNPRTVLVFATAHEQYMRSAFEVYAFDYLVKPFRAERALNTLKLIRERLTAQPAAAAPVRAPESAASGRLMLRHRDGLSFVDIPSILLIQREERSSVLYLADGALCDQRFARRIGGAAARRPVLPHAQELHRQLKPDRIHRPVRPLDVHHQAPRHRPRRADYARAV